MRSNNSNGSRAAWARGFMALWSALIVASGGASAAPVETVLHTFTGSPSDGAFPEAGLIADSSGNLYGTTYADGASGTGCGGSGCGVVFKLAPGGTETVLYSFTGGGDGGNSTAGLIADSSGNLYGTTRNGGASNLGVVFKLTPPATASGAWTETVLHFFTGYPNDGANPAAGLIADSSGNLYGTTSGGGGLLSGVVFKLSPSEPETVLYTFTGGSDGANPEAGLTADSKGNLYGTTAFGGASGDGVVFKLTPGGTETVLYNFCTVNTPTSCSDGSEPFAGLLADSNGNLYGTTNFGGASNVGAVFKLSPGGTETVLYSFNTGERGGAFPPAGLIADSGGNL
jgi:uncharacterized repeat protein (TIGR03803 family)